MSGDLGGSPGPPVQRADLIAYFEQAALASGPLRIGAEYEWLPVEPQSGRARGYSGPAGVEELLRALLAHGFADPQGAARPIHLQRGETHVNMEPGAQLELASAPVTDLHALARELEGFAALAGRLARELGFRLLGHGIQPVSRAEAIEQVPKRRYAIMVEYFRERGAAHYLDMMRRTAAVQVSLDYTGEQDAGSKLRAALLATPVIQALCANAPLAEGRPNGLASERVLVWRETDPSRCGPLRVALSGPWSFERLVDHLLAVPVLHVRAEDGGVAPGRGVPFRELLERGIQGRRAVLADWELHLTGIFTDVRLKRVVECRAADALPPVAGVAVPALYTGLLYHAPSRHEAIELLAPYAAHYDALQIAAARHGLGAVAPDGRPVRALADELVRLARAGLAARGLGEERYLEPLAERLEAGEGFAELVLRAFRRGGMAAVVEQGAL
ncbi:MAG: glutamate--cysteine ligase [Planctomycetota bacterium]|nr:MAG: glutamate--cysteine ligase [Planctomycetota bacterium]